MSEEIKSQGIQSIEVGMEILKKVAEANQPVTITELAALCETSKSKLHRYLISFVRTGMLQKDSDAKYILGTEILRLGLKASHNLNTVDLAQPHLLQLKERFDETVALAMWGENGPFFVSWEESKGPVNIGIKIGSHVRVTDSAAGVVFSSYLPKELTRMKIEEELSTSVSSIDEFEKKLEFVRENKYSYVVETIISGINAIAAPIFDRNHKVVAALTVIGWSHSISVEPDSELVRALKLSGKAISEKLGHVDGVEKNV
jgi:DNA-binding IclR family transcriptional regulator